MNELHLRLVSALGARMQEKACFLLEQETQLTNAYLPDLIGNGRKYLPIHVSTFDGQDLVAQKLIELGADPSAREPTHMNWTALHFAAQHHQVRIAEILIAAGAEVNATDTEGKTPLHWAAINNTPPITDLLIRQGAAINVKDMHEFTPLDYATENKHNQIIDQLKLALEG